MFVCIRSSLHSVRFGQLLRCAHKRIVNKKIIMKVNIERHNIQVELIRFRENSDFIGVGNFEVGIYFRDGHAHCYPRRVASNLLMGRRARRTFRDMTTSVHSISGHIQFGIVISGHAQFGT